MFMDSSGYDPVGEGDKSQNKQKQSAGLVVEEPADEQQIDVAQVKPALSFCCLTAHDQRKQCEDQRKERPEIELGEQQRRVRVKGKYVVPEIHNSQFTMHNYLFLPKSSPLRHCRLCVHRLL